MIRPRTVLHRPHIARRADAGGRQTNTRRPRPCGTSSPVAVPAGTVLACCTTLLCTARGSRATPRSSGHRRRLGWPGGKRLTPDGFDPPTSGIRIQRASTAPRCLLKACAGLAVFHKSPQRPHSRHCCDRSGDLKNVKMNNTLNLERLLSCRLQSCETSGNCCRVRAGDFSVYRHVHCLHTCLSVFIHWDLVLQG